MNKFLLNVFFIVASLSSDAQWYHVNPGTTSYLSDLSFVNADTGFAVSSPWLWRTNNGGATWQMVFNDAPVYSISFITADTGLAYNEFRLLKTVNGGQHWDTVMTDSNLLWFSDPYWLSHQEIVIAQATYFTSDTIKIFKSVDGGDHWSLFSEAVDYRVGQSVDQIIYADAMTSYLFSSGTMLKSVDGGITWSFVKTFGYNCQFFTPDTGYALNTSYFYRTNDGGQSWDSTQTYIPSIAYEMHFINRQVGFICGGNGFNAGFVYKTTNGGITWTLDLSDVQTFDRFSWCDSTVYASGTGGSVIKNDFYSGLSSPEIAAGIFPNPTVGKVTIYKDRFTTINPEIFNVMGERLNTFSMTISPEEITLDLSHFKPGVYFMQACSDDKLWRVKIIKQ